MLPASVGRGAMLREALAMTGPTAGILCIYFKVSRLRKLRLRHVV